MEEDFVKVGYNYQLTLTHLLEHAAKMHPKEEIVYRDIFRYNYAELYKRCQRLSSALEGLGVKRGSRVGSFEWNTHRFLEMYFGIQCMGAIMHLGNPLLTPSQIVYIVNHTEDEVLLVNKDFVPLIEGISDKLETVKHYIILTDDGKLPKTKLKPVYEYEELLESVPPNYEYPDLEESTVAGMCYTTGTMGDPKGCYFTHRALSLLTLVTASRMSQYEIDTRFDAIIIFVPMFHVFGWGLPYIGTYFGMKQLYTGRFDPKVILEMLRNEKRTGQRIYGGAVATMIREICYHPEVEQYKEYLKGVVLFGGGGLFPRGLAQRVQELGMTPMAGWGMTEAAYVGVSVLKSHMWDWPEDKKLAFKLRTGWALPFLEQRVVDEKGNAVKADGKQYGEIIFRAPWATPGYYKDPERSKELWRGGWLHTGDIATVDEEGNVLIVDRDKDVIKSGGEWISTLILENLISMHPKALEVAVVGVPSRRWEERPIAIVVPKEEYKGKLSGDELREHLMKHVETGKILKWWIPDKFIFVDEIPKTSVGKYDKKMLRPAYKDVLDT